MKFSTAVVSNLLVAAAFAAPKGSGLAGRIARRGAGTRSSAPVKLIESANAAIKNQSNVEYSSNWSGAVITSPPSGETFNAVSATFTVPTPSVPTDGDSSNADEWAASAWVGIDGDTYQNAILQTGIDFVVTSSGEVGYDAWYEWYPDYAYDFDLDVSAGDVISVSVYADTTTSGTATIENETTGETVSISLSSSYELGGQNAEWIVEDFEEDDELVAFADFGTVTFSNCVAATSESSEGASDATTIDIEDDSGDILTSVTIVSDTEVTVTYL